MVAWLPTLCIQNDLTRHPLMFCQSSLEMRQQSRPCSSYLSARIYRWRLDMTSQKCVSWAVWATSWAALAIRRWQGTRFGVTLLVGAAKLPLPVLFIHTSRELKYNVLKITNQTSVCLSGLSLWLSGWCLITSHSTSVPALTCITEETSRYQPCATLLMYISQK